MKGATLGEWITGKELKINTSKGWIDYEDRSESQKKEDEQQTHK
jgi:hypothetical protein